MLKLFNKYSFGLLILLIWLECILFFSWINVFGCLVLLFGWYLINNYILKQEVLENHPGAFFVSLGLGIFYYYFPLVGTLMAGRPLTFEFLLPFEVFVHQTVFVLAYVLAFILYQKNSFRPFRIRKFLFRLGLFNPPSDSTLWVMGFIGVGIFLYTKILVGISQFENQEVSPTLRFLIPIINFVYAPILILFKGMYSGSISYQNQRKMTSKPLFIFAYIVGLVLMSFLGNGREFMISSIMVLILLFLFDILLKKLNFTEVFTAKKLILGSLLIFILLGPFAKMANAMILVRDQRKTLSAYELFEATIKTYNSKELDEFMKDIEIPRENYLTWHENYTDNVFFDRMANLRIADGTIYYLRQANFDHSLALNTLNDHWIAQIPGPILKFLGIRFDKFSDSVTYTAISLATKEVYNSTDAGLSVAAHTGTGLWLFGYWYPIFFIFIYYMMFFYLDMLVLPTKTGIIVSVLFLINIYSIFSRLNFKNGIFSDILFMGRSFVQMILLYVLIFFVSRKIASLF